MNGTCVTVTGYNQFACLVVVALSNQDGECRSNVHGKETASEAKTRSVHNPQVRLCH